MSTIERQPSAGFYGLGIAPKLLSVLDSLKFEIPTPIQHQAIPGAIEGKDMVGIAQTGTGKTIAFAIPMIQKMAATQGRGLVLTPTRELALQVSEVFRQFAPSMGITGCVLIGGQSISMQIQELRRNPRIIIATPGRLQDHLTQGTVSLKAVNMVVLDEADRMFDMGFAPQIERILTAVPKERQTMLFSATMPDEIMKLAARHMKLPTRVEVATQGTIADKVEQQLYVVNREAKPDLLNKLLQSCHGSVLLFVRTKHNAAKITKLIREMGHSAAEIHSNRSLNQRREALEGFKVGKYRVLAATDIAARGIDVAGIEMVINYDLPDDDTNYVHRIGRTGRAGRPGKAVSFAAPDQASEVKSIERLIRMPLPLATHPDVPSARLHGTGGGKPPQRRGNKTGARSSSGPRSFGGPQKSRTAHKPAGNGYPRQQFGSKPAPFGAKPASFGQKPAASSTRPPRYNRDEAGPARPRFGKSPYAKGAKPAPTPRQEIGRAIQEDSPRNYGVKTDKQPKNKGWLSKFFKKK